MENENIIQSTREALGLVGNTTDFKPELIMHINAALGILNQNGVGITGFRVTTESVWADFKDVLQIHGNDLFHIVPDYVFTKTKMLFDPPPPSSVEFYTNYTKELLWRLRMAYEEDNDVDETVTTV